MRGTILGFDAASGTGAINDASGGRLKFSRDAWRSPGEPVPGRAVDFEVVDGEAVDIFLVPGGFNFGTDDPAKSAMTAGAVSLGCALLSPFLHVFGILTLIVAIGFGIKGKNLGRALPDRTPYFLSIAGLVLAGLQLLVVVLGLAACASLIGLIGVSTYYWH
jgi:hypothetical protein